MTNTATSLPPLTKAERNALLFLAGLRPLPGTQTRVAGVTWTGLRLHGFTQVGADRRPEINEAGRVEAQRLAG